MQLVQWLLAAPTEQLETVTKRSEALCSTFCSASQSTVASQVVIKPDGAWTIAAHPDDDPHKAFARLCACADRAVPWVTQKEQFVRWLVRARWAASVVLVLLVRDDSAADALAQRLVRATNLDRPAFRGAVAVQSKIASQYWPPDARDAVEHDPIGAVVAACETDGPQLTWEGRRNVWAIQRALAQLAEQ